MLNWRPELHAVGVTEMDASHEQFLQELVLLSKADDAQFVSRFHALALHTRAHFDTESQLMRACGFPASAEHESEHRRVLSELALVGRGIAARRLGLARAYIAIGMPDWFRRHLLTMDSALAASLKAQSAGAPASRMLSDSPDRAP